MIKIINNFKIITAEGANGLPIDLTSIFNASFMYPDKSLIISNYRIFNQEYIF